jgi:dCMP deaminase
MRTSRDIYFLDIAHRCAQQGTCLRRNFGAVLVDQSGTIISTGYSGAPRGVLDCTKRKTCWREVNNIPSGQNYERCFSVHAEQNALIQAGKKARGGTMYISGFDVKTGEYERAMPCFLCAKMILNAEISRVVIQTEKDRYISLDPYEIYKGHVKKLLS